MTRNAGVLARVAAHAISGRGAHAEARVVFSALDWRAAGVRPEGAPHSLYQLLGHVIYWQEWVLKWFKGKAPAIPRHAAGSWRGAVAPASRAAWEQTVSRFQKGLDELEGCSRSALLVRRGKKTGLEMLQTIGAHTSYHAGQAVLLRQMLGAWPPPEGGLTW